MFDTLRSTVRDLGWPNALLYWLSRVLHRASGGRLRLLKYLLVAQPVADHDVTPERRGRGIEISEATPQTILATDFGRPAAVIAERLRIGSHCLLAHRDGQLVGFQWFTTRDYPEDEVRCLFELRPEDRCAWDFDIFVMPEARAQPVFMRLWDACNARLRAQGVTLSLSRINAFNSASVRAHARMGARTIAASAFITLGRWQLALLPTRPWVHISREDAPRLPISRLARQGQIGT